jgi:uncharacterized protein with PIN domain
MSPTEVDYWAFSLLLLRYLGILFGGYLLVVIVLRLSNYYRITNCPNCSGELKRSQRGPSERFTKLLSLGILDLKRYRCYTCYWEGSALDIKNNKKRDE